MNDEKVVRTQRKSISVAVTTANDSHSSAPAAPAHRKSGKVLPWAGVVRRMMDRLRPVCRHAAGPTSYGELPGPLRVESGGIHRSWHKPSAQTGRSAMVASPAVYLLLFLTIAGLGCPSLEGQEPGPTPPSGYSGILFLNSGKSLVQTIIALTYPSEPPIVWVNAVAPRSWDPLLFDCGYTEVNLVSAIPVNLATGLEGETVEFGGDPLRTGEALICGSLIVVEVDDTTNPDGSTGLQLSTRTIPDTLPQNPASFTTSAVAPGPASNLVLARYEGIRGLSMQFSATWDSPSGRVFVSRLDLGGAGPTAAALYECPVPHVGWGNLVDPTVSGATLPDTSVQFPAPAPLEEGRDFTCGDTITLRAVGDAGTPDAVRLELSASASGSAVPAGAPDLFGSIRSVLDEAGMAGRLSTNLALLPSPGALSETTP